MLQNPLIIVIKRKSKIESVIVKFILMSKQKSRPKITAAGGLMNNSMTKFLFSGNAGTIKTIQIVYKIIVVLKNEIHIFVKKKNSPSGQCSRS